MPEYLNVISALSHVFLSAFWQVTMLVERWNFVRVQLSELREPVTPLDLRSSYQKELGRPLLGIWLLIAANREGYGVAALLLF
jgi:hypothetical protein